MKEKIIVPSLTLMMLAPLTSCSSMEQKYGYPLTFDQIVVQSETNPNKLLLEYRNKGFDFQDYQASGTLYYQNEKVGSIILKSAENSYGDSNTYIYFNFSIEGIQMEIESWHISEESTDYTNSNITINLNGENYSSSNKTKERNWNSTTYGGYVTNLSFNYPAEILSSFNKIGVSEDNYLVCETNSNKTFKRVVVDVENAKPIFIATEIELENISFISNFQIDYNKQSAITAPSDAESYSY